MKDSLERIAEDIQEFLLNEFGFRDDPLYGLIPYFPFRRAYFLMLVSFRVADLEKAYRPPSNPGKKKGINNPLRKRVFERDAYRCIECKSFKNLHIDHVKPLVRGGTNDIGNLRTLCQKCNLSKGSKLSI